ncbi:Sca4 family protein [Rickettsia endosymbiont of Oedothorax gibbosus]|uniref:Sca4 family protein n=1 Tax=Rickettsia endosymbiont of Oedothorax gibbosus TaxID=931099 RepID=UPI0020255200|nr:Sca4 family protein [Rickettsia endosymbiont of Oedothorax gibbosus]
MSEFTNLQYYKRKEFGANEAGELGGIYSSQDNILFMVKKENKPEKNISEFLGSQIFQATNPEHGAKVSLIVPDHLTTKVDQEGGLQNDGSEVYVQSEFFKNYSGDMYVDMDNHMSKKTKPGGWLRKDGGRPLFMGTRELLSSTLTKAFEELHYSDFDKIAPTSLLIGDFDIHTGNIGVVRDTNNSTIPPRLVRLDFAGSFDQLDDEIRPHSWSRHLPLLGPTNHFREFPSTIKYNDLFVKGLLDTAQVDLNNTIDNSFVELSKYYSDKALANWAKMTMSQKFKNIAPENIKIADVKDALKETMQKRQQSLKEYGLQIKLGLLVTRGKINKPELKKLVQEHFDYFNNIIDQRKRLELKKKTEGNYVEYILGNKTREVLLIKEIAQIVKEQKKALTNPTLERTDLSVASKKALDVMHINDTITTTTETQATEQTSPYKLAPSEIVPAIVAQSKVAPIKVDLVTLAFRQEIIDKQQTTLKNILAEANITAISVANLAVNSQQFKEFVENNNELIQKTWANSITKSTVTQAMNDEVQSYAKIHQANNFKPLTWSNQPPIDNTTDTRSRVIKVKDEELFKLTETKVKTSTKVILEDGVTEIEISNYRNINLPLAIKPSGTAVHLSFPVQNEKGENIEVSKALYFTTHYNEQGKLVEITNPLSLKFTGDDKDAIGYIQRGKHIYTIPVTKGQYEAMLQEVAKNQGCSINISQTISSEASDLLIHNSELKQIQSNLKRHITNTPTKIISSMPKTSSQQQIRNRT